MLNLKKPSCSQFYITSLRGLLIAIFICSGFSTFHVCAQTRPYSYRTHWRDTTFLEDRKINIIKTNILGYLIGDFNITYERLSPHSPRSLVVKLDYNYYSTEEEELKNPNIMIGIRRYLSKKKEAPAGYYLQPFFTYGEYSIFYKIQNYGVHINQIGGGIIGGKQWAIGKRVTIDIFIGGEYFSISGDNHRANRVSEGFGLIIGASTGFRF